MHMTKIMDKLMIDSSACSVKYDLSPKPSTRAEAAHFLTVQAVVSHPSTDQAQPCLASETRKIRCI